MVVRIDCPGRSIVVKQALPELRVAQVWKSDPSRLGVEADFMRCMEKHLAELKIPRLLRFDADGHLLAMEAVDDDAPTWKTVMMQGSGDVETARRIGEIAARIHNLAASLSDEERQQFESKEHFEALRLQAYFQFAGDELPDKRFFLYQLAQHHRQAGHALVHGDFTPKNILVTGAGPILLDHEVAHLGCSAFDTASILNHLYLKAAAGFLTAEQARSMAEAFLDGYHQSGGVTDEWLLPTFAGLLVARVAGKSPVEYHTARSRRLAMDAADYIIDKKARTVLEVFALL